MRAAVAVFRDELAARRRFLLLALVAGLIPFAAVGLYPRGGASPADVRGATALAIAGTLGFLLAIGIGSSLFAPELASGRLRYWLCRPVSATALWLGRNAAALVAIYASVLLALFPTTLTGDLGWHTIDSISIAHAPGTPRVYLLFALLALALVFFLGQGLGLLERSRSRWLALDLLGLAAVGSALGATGSRLFWAGALVTRIAVGLLFALALLLALVLAGFVSLRRGRADLAHTHRLFSLTLWCALGLATSALGAYGWSTLHPGPDRLRLDTTRVIAPAEARWFALSGGLSGRSDLHGLFVCEESSGDCRHLGFDVDSTWREALSVIAAPSGNAMTWFGPSGDGYARFLAETHDRAAPIALQMPADRVVDSALAFSPDGVNLATLSSGRATLLRTQDGSVTRTFPLPGFDHFGYPGWESRFVDKTSLVVARLVSEAQASGSRSRSLQARRIDFDRALIRDVGRVALAPLDDNTIGGYATSLSPRGGLVAIRPWLRDWRAVSSEALGIFRVEPGMPSLLAPSLASATALPTWLPDERAIWTRRSHEGLILHWLEPATGEVHDIALPGVARFAAVAARGEVLVASVSADAEPPLPPNSLEVRNLADPRGAPLSWRAVAVHLATGEIRTLGEGLRAILPALRSAPLGTRALFVDGRGRVVEIDPRKESQRVWLTAELGGFARE
ncbi:MAG: hypothetical protein IPJ17_04175 [Holophagales bacterium]|nr:MAG: hypothetical protein IPJ17_04175 [Holophagales bacterium]